MAIDFVPIRIAGVGDRPRLQWAEGRRFTLPRGVLERAPWRDCVGSSADLTIPAGPLNVEADDALRVREHAQFTDQPPLSTRLPVSYQLVPPLIRAAAASIVGRRQRGKVTQWAAFPGWPLDLTADLLSDLAEVPRVSLGDRTPVMLTHDIDSPEGLLNLVSLFLPIEEAAGARSASFVVPCAWPLDEGLLADVRDRGHEIGVHGFDHSNRTPFAEAEERRRRLDAAVPFIRRYGTLGYRAPSLLRTRALLTDLRSRYAYDSSIPTSGGLFPVPNNGCASARPCLIDGLIEIPLSLPRDGSLRFLGYRPAEILRLWIDCTAQIAESGGAVVLLTHCERRFSGNRAMLDAYRQFIEYVDGRRDRLAFCTPAELLPRLRTGLGAPES